MTLASIWKDLRALHIPLLLGLALLSTGATAMAVSVSWFVPLQNVVLLSGVAASAVGAVVILADRVGHHRERGPMESGELYGRHSVGVGYTMFLLATIKGTVGVLQQAG